MADIASDLLDRILTHAAATPGREVCGLLLGHGDHVEQVQPCANVAADPTRHFEIDPAALIAAHRAARAGGAAVIGHYHSHPSGSAVPSARDAADAAADGALWLIVAAGAVQAWRAVDAGAAEGRFAAELLAILPGPASVKT
ncbi:M67 family metallopeptidase [Sphingomonas sp. XXL09]|uniref:M67 family metallopeptidase n=1 Tax=Sphingomonas sp. XXL09 TaxID=3457787 RepID=UPI00406BD9DF